MPASSGKANYEARRLSIVVRRGTYILAARAQALVRAELMMSGHDRDHIVRRADIRFRVCHVCALAMTSRPRSAPGVRKSRSWKSAYDVPGIGSQSPTGEVVVLRTDLQQKEISISMRSIILFSVSHPAQSGLDPDRYTPESLYSRCLPCPSQSSQSDIRKSFDTKWSRCIGPEER